MSRRGYRKVMAAQHRRAVQAAAEQGRVLEERYLEALERKAIEAAEDLSVDSDIEEYLMDQHEQEG